MKSSSFWLAALCLSASAFAVAMDPAGSGTPVAQVGPVTITSSDLSGDAGLALQQYQLENDLYQRKRAWLDRKTREILYSLAAKDAKTSLEAWRKKEIDDKVTAPTTAEIDTALQNTLQMYAQRNQPVTDPAVIAQLRQRAADDLKGRKQAQRESEVYVALTQKYPVSVTLPPPVAPNVKIPYNPTDPVKGPADAKITIVEFTDIQCPFCARSQATLHQVLDAYPKDVKLVAKGYPLPGHNRARPAQEAAMCAHEQGKFFEFRDKAFANQQKLEDADLIGYAKEVGVRNMKKFESCYKDRKYASAVEADFQAGQSLGVQGTPHFFVGTAVVNGAQPFDRFKAAIDAQLAAK